MESDPGPVADEPQHLRELRHMQEAARLLVSNLDPQAALDELAAAGRGSTFFLSLLPAPTA